MATATLVLDRQPMRGDRINRGNPLARDLVAYWPMLEGTGEFLRDYSGNELHGDAWTAISSDDWVGGKNGPALDFDGLGDLYAKVVGPDHDLLSPTDGGNDSPFSIACWIRSTDFDSVDRIVTKLDSSATEWSLSLTSGEPQVRFYTSASDYIGRQSTSSITIGQWYHLVATYDGSESAAGIKLFLDGVRVDNTNANSGTYTGCSNTDTPVAIGNNYSSFFPFDGQIGATAVWRRELSAAEIRQLHTHPWSLFNPRAVPQESSTATVATLVALDRQPMRGDRPNLSHPLMRGCVGVWPFNEGTGNVAADLSGNAANATQTFGLSGPVWEPGKIGTSQRMWDDRWTIPTHSKLQISTNDFSWSWWMRRNGDQPPYAGIWENSTLGTTDSIVIRFLYDVVQLRLYATTTLTSGVVPTDGEWEHWSITKTYRTYTFYQNGKQVAEEVSGSDAAVTSADIRLGVYYNGGTDTTCNLNVSNWMLFDRALTASEIRQLHTHPWSLFNPRTVPQESSTPTAATLVALDRQPIRGDRPNLSHPLMRGCKVYYPFVEATGNVVKDFSGNANHATMQQAAQAGKWGGGKIGNALTFDRASSDSLSANWPGINWNTGDWTISLWYRNNVAAGYERVLASGDGSYGVQIAWEELSYLALANASGTAVSKARWNTVPSVGEWVLLTATKRSGVWSVFYNGTPDDLAPGILSFGQYTTAGLWVGQRGNGQYANMGVSSLLIHDRALTASEIRQLYTHPWSLFNPRTVPLESDTPTTTTVTPTTTTVTPTTTTVAPTTTTVAPTTTTAAPTTTTVAPTTTTVAPTTTTAAPTTTTVAPTTTTVAPTTTTVAPTTTTVAPTTTTVAPTTTTVAPTTTTVAPTTTTVAPTTTTVAPTPTDVTVQSSVTVQFLTDGESDITRGFGDVTTSAERIAGTIVIGTSEETISMATNDGCPAFVANLDAANYVEIGTATGDYTWRINAGDICLIPLAPNVTTLYFKADTAPVLVRYDISAGG